jgi:hypothetical protein
MLPLAVSSTLTFYGKGYCVYPRGNIPSKELLQIAKSLRVAESYPQERSEAETGSGQGERCA